MPASPRSIAAAGTGIVVLAALVFAGLRALAPGESAPAAVPQRAAGPSPPVVAEISAPPPAFAAAFARVTYYRADLAGVSPRVARLFPPGFEIRDDPNAAWVLQALVTLRNAGSEPVQIGRGAIGLERETAVLLSSPRPRGLFEEETVVLAPGAEWERYADWNVGRGPFGETAIFLVSTDSGPPLRVVAAAARVTPEDLRAAIAPATASADPRPPAAIAAVSASPSVASAAPAPAPAASLEADAARLEEMLRAAATNPGASIRLTPEESRHLQDRLSEMDRAWEARAMEELHRHPEIDAATRERVLEAAREAVRRARTSPPAP